MPPSIRPDTFFDPVTAQCPFDYFRRARETSPVLKLTVPATGKPFYLITRYEDVAAALKNPELFSSRFMNPFGRDQVDSDVEALMKTGVPVMQTLLMTDPPEHWRYRSLVNRAFTPKKVKAIEPFIESVIQSLIDSFRSTGRCEFVTDFARPLPLRVIADQVGVLKRDIPRLKQWSEGFVARLGAMLPKEEELAATQEVVDFQNYLLASVHSRRNSPEDDLMSELVHAQIDDQEPLSDIELVSMLQQLLVAGNETTSSTLAGGMMSLLQHPEQLAAVMADPALIPNLVEESLRTVSPQAGIWRITTRDTKISGVPLPAGSTLMLRYDAANRDPEVFQAPEDFDICRDELSKHMAFGMGVHFCIGSTLARRELALSFEMLLREMKDLRLAPGNDFLHHPNTLMRGLKALHLEFTPAA